MKKAIIIVLVIAVVVAVVGCTSQVQPNASGSASDQSQHLEEQQFTNNSESSQLLSTEQGIADKPQEDIEMESTFRELVDSNYFCITTLFYYGVLPFDATGAASDDQFATVKSDEFNNIDALRAFLTKTYTQAEVDRLLNHYIDGTPLYVDNEGALMVDLSQASYAGMPTPWESYTVTIVSKDDEKCVFTVDAQYPSDPLREGPSNGVYSFCAIYEDGWKLSEMVYKPD